MQSISAVVVAVAVSVADDVDNVVRVQCILIS